MNDLANTVQIVETDETLSSDFSAQVDGHLLKENYSFVLVLLDDLKEVHSQNLKDHAEVVSVGSFVDEGV